jgi:hypothetical protein
MVSGSWDMTSPLIEMVRPMSDMAFIDTPSTRSRLAKGIPKELLALTGKKRGSMSAVDPKRRTQSGVRLRIGVWHVNLETPPPDSEGVE